MTVLATQDSNGNPIADIDGTTWDPFARRLLFTTENQNAPTYSATPDYPSQVVDVSGALGRGGYEGVQDDSEGNLWIVEDIGGAFKGATTAKVPNSFVYRYVPKKPGDLANGKLQVLQVLNASNEPITQATQTALQSPDQLALHTYGSVFDTKWITIHDTATREHALQRQPCREGRERHAVQAAGERRLPARREVRGVLLRRDRRHRRDQSRERLLRRLDVGVQAHAGRPVVEHGQAAALLQGRPGARRVRQRRIHDPGP